MSKNISVKTALITGANRGLGLAFARQLALDGWQIHIAARNVGHLKTVYQNEKIPFQTAYAFDLTKTPLEDIKAMVRSIDNLQLVIHTASPYITKPFMQSTIEEMTEYSQCMLRDQVLAQSSLNQLMANPVGGILIFTGAVIGSPGYYERGLMAMLKAHQNFLAGICSAEAPSAVHVKHLNLGSFRDFVAADEKNKFITTTSVVKVTIDVIAAPERYPNNINLLSKENEKTYGLTATPVTQLTHSIIDL
jgi:NAD(P)-dependent dehydrogenase (short-subunit alcohol dehydrogenase family)